ncbi:pyroglutamyl-peptidase I [Bifidobacterium moukalabense]|uniref:pyroglutamyl-peptidase I n=1 Tax=Bifidobacterium moukalabense TaxID=1333651 RepID=UPI0010F6D3F0|nr:pyroglutamyl-peptidase I [Bifidobacterium moukalabense]
MQQINIVISGFDPYEGVDVNPAMLVPQALAEQWRSPSAGETDHDDSLQGVDMAISTVMLPVSFANAWPALLEAIEKAQPDIIIATGLKRSSRGILLERCATNLMDAAKPDADNVIPSRRPINPEGPAAYWTRLPLRSILKDFAKHEIPATLSSDAGTFVCNSLFYHLLDWSAQQDRRILSGFVSLPVVNEQPHPQHGLPLAQQIAAGRDVIRETVRYYLQPSSGDILLG